MLISKLSQCPNVHQLLEKYSSIDLPHELKKWLIQQTCDKFKTKIKKGNAVSETELYSALESAFFDVSTPLKKVINGTGVILHTGLGRASYSKRMIDNLSILNDSYVNLEYDLASGKRGNRHNHLKPWIQSLSGAEDGILVNNNAAAVFLALNTLANRKEVILSRGQMVEIGGAFRIPEIIKKSGAKLKEIGTTNRTHLRDYENAITPKTKLILWVHASNYEVQGFTKDVPLSELVKLGAKHNIPVMADLGSGAFFDISHYHLSKEPLVREIVQTGVDIITYSVDKLLGGPQGGIIVGRKSMIKKMEKNNLLRILRPDKTQILLTISAMQDFISKSHVEENNPLYRDLSIDKMKLKERIDALLQRINSSEISLECVASKGRIGSGAIPSEYIPSYALSCFSPKISAQKLAQMLRMNTMPIVPRIENNHVIIDFLTIREEDIHHIETFFKGFTIAS